MKAIWSAILPLLLPLAACSEAPLSEGRYFFSLSVDPASTCPAVILSSWTEEVVIDVFLENDEQWSGEELNSQAKLEGYFVDEGAIGRGYSEQRLRRDDSSLSDIHLEGEWELELYNRHEGWVEGSILVSYSWYDALTEVSDACILELDVEGGQP